MSINWIEECESTNIRNVKERRELIKLIKVCFTISEENEKWTVEEALDESGFFDEPDFVMDLFRTGCTIMNSIEINDYTINKGLLGNFNFIMDNVFDIGELIDCEPNEYLYNVLLFLNDSFGLERCIKNKPKEVLALLKSIYEDYSSGDWAFMFINCPELYVVTVPEQYSKEYSELFDKMKTEVDEDLKYLPREVEKTYQEKCMKLGV